MVIVPYRSAKKKYVFSITQRSSDVKVCTLSTKGTVLSYFTSSKSVFSNLAVKE